MLLSIVIMTIGTGLIAIMPSLRDDRVGRGGWLLIARLLQGLAVAGGFGSATAFTRRALQEREGFFASFSGSGRDGSVLNICFGVILFCWLTTDELEGSGLHAFPFRLDPTRPLWRS